MLGHPDEFPYSDMWLLFVVYKLRELRAEKMNSPKVLMSPMTNPPIQIERGLTMSFKKPPINGAAPRAIPQENQ
jgi:hypothetical protein